MRAEDIAGKLHARPCATGWMAKCPAHEDRSPSLSIREGDGKVLLHCFAGCSLEAICNAAKIAIPDLFYQPGKIHPKPRAVREAEKQIASLRSRLSPRERLLPITVVQVSADALDEGIAHCLALTILGEAVQAVLV